MEVILLLTMKSNMKYIELASNKDHVHNVEKYVLSKDVKRATQSICTTIELEFIVMFLKPFITRVVMQIKVFLNSIVSNNFLKHLKFSKQGVAK